MNLRNVGSYNIGLDIGTGSVGWAVTDEEGNLWHFNGKPTWGSRLFPSADGASKARAPRSLRRRYDRRRQRLDLLQGFFCEEIESVDPEFFIRLNQSRLLPEDRADEHSDYRWPLFNDPDFDERSYYEKFPTIYHLRKWLMETDEKADIRLIYLAFHNIVKHRGNFLQQENRSLTSKNASVKDSVLELCDALENWCEDHEISCNASENCDAICEALTREKLTKTGRKELIAPLFVINENLQIGFTKKMATDMAKAIAGAIVGASADMDKLFFVFDEKPEGLTTKIYLSNDDHVTSFEENCPEDGVALFEAMNRVYSAFVLQGILSLVPGASISVNKVAEYERYGKDLKTLKALVQEYAPEKYDEFFRGPLYPKLYPGEKPKYSVSDAKGYTKYNASHKYSYDDFRKEVEKLFKSTGAEEDDRYESMMDGFANEVFLRRLKTSDNGCIPFQLHREEMDAIIEKQGRFYPFLIEQEEKLKSLVEFRIPYYVGPLTQKNARKVADKEDGALRFAWAERLPGKEGEKIYPWNWDQIIDRDESAERFIRRMTGTCTYIQGEPVLPRCSLLYEEFCVLNELNGAHYTRDGDEHHRFTYKDRADMINELFSNGSVSYAKVSDWMAKRGTFRVHVSGGQGEKGFESRLSSYIFFKKDIFKVDEIDPKDYPMIEEIILWNTVFEDRDILKRKLKEAYGDRLTDEQIKKICRKRFAGWGKLSKRFLTEIKAQTDNGPMSIMDVLREGDPSNGHGFKAMVLMEALRDDKLRFQELVDEINAEKLADGATLALEELPGSPALRRGINQALGIVKEIVHIAGHEPSNIFIEVTRSEDEKKKGQRTKRRAAALQEQLKKLKEESSEFYEDSLLRELDENASKLDEKLTLYFMQGGKSLYSGKPLDINRLYEYQVDHIIPQSYTVDNSFENKALVLSEENQRKSDEMLLPWEMRTAMSPYWEALASAELIGRKKLSNLKRPEITDKQLKGFINRQLVETSQIIKTVQLMLKGLFPDTTVVPVKAGLSSELKRSLDIVKCREINDFHHAHDAYLACEIGRFIELRFPEMYTNPLQYKPAIRRFIKKESVSVRKGRMPYGAPLVISSFLRSGFDEETGEITRDTWDAAAEIGRIKRAMNMKQCLITRMPEETSGAFWDETIYSPRDPKKKDQLRLPLKKGLDPKKYGSYSREQVAYFFIYRAIKKNKESLCFASVPVSVAASMKSSSDALLEYAQTLAQDDGAELTGIVRPKIYKYQLIEENGSRLYITGKEEVRNGVQIALDQNDARVAEMLLDLLDDKTQPTLTNDEVDHLYYSITHSMQCYSMRLSKQLRLGSWDDIFIALDLQNKAHVVSELLAIANGVKNQVDLTSVGLSKYSGCMKVRFNGLLGEKGICLVDQSITGMFERRTPIGL